MEPVVPVKVRGKRNSQESADAVCALPEECKLDTDHVLSIVGIVALVLNLLIVVLMYVYTLV